MRAPDFWYSPPGTASTLLAPFGALYDLAGRLRRGLTRPERVTVPVLCVGNLVAGGAGKTPVVLDLTRRLAARGRTPHAISRGYGGRATGRLQVDPERHDVAEVGDEPLLLARAAPTWIARDRVAGAKAAIDAGADCLLLDDGFQNPALVKDLSLVVVDAAAGFGNRRIMPAGPLRETVSAGLARCDAVVLIGEGDPALPGAREVLRARLEPAGDAKAYHGRKVLAFAGIGRPEKFFETLQGAGAEIVGRRSFPDHHPYTAAETERLLAEAERLGARPVTTGKDAVRLPPALRGKVDVFGIDLRWADEAAIDALLDRFLATA